MKEAWEIWNEILLKPSESLTGIEQTIFRVNVFECGFLGGGWLLNLGPKTGKRREYTELRRTAEAVAEISATAVAQWLVQVATAAENMRLAENWGPDAFESVEYRQIAELEKRISAEMDSLHVKLVAYTQTHFECQ